MKSTLFGFFLNRDIQLDITNKRLVRYQAETAANAMFFKVVTLTEQQLRLLLLLLDNESRTVTLKDDIIKHVWDDKQPYPSDQRLWYLIKVLRNKLISLGIPDGGIANAHGIGYFIDIDNCSRIFVD